MLTQLPEAKFPEEPINGPNAGAFEYVMELSSQFWFATRWAWIPVAELEVVNKRRVAFVTVPLKSFTLKRR
jgi:hypothetical protein